MMQKYNSIFKTRLSKKHITILISALYILYLIITSLIGNGVQNIEVTPESSQSTSSIPSNMYKVKRVVDGDTIELENGQKVRYIGIDTPETVKPNSAVECFGKEASNKNKELVEGKTVRLEKDVSETDRFGRLLRYVYVDDIFVNDFLVREGYANSASFPPDIKNQDRFRDAEVEAKSNNRGLWSTCRIN